MQMLGTLDDARAKVFQDARACVERITNIATTAFGDADGGVLVLQQIRAETYEDLNQIQHEHMILRAVEWLIEHGVCPADTQWEWNPRQTGDDTEPDLRGTHGGRCLVCAEITTSAKPEGAIDTHMRKTLTKLARQPAPQYYFVGTAPMARRARTKTSTHGWPIRVIDLNESIRTASPA